MAEHFYCKECDFCVDDSRCCERCGSRSYYVVEDEDSRIAAAIAAARAEALETAAKYLEAEEQRLGVIASPQIGRLAYELRALALKERG